MGASLIQISRGHILSVALFSTVDHNVVIIFVPSYPIMM